MAVETTDKKVKKETKKVREGVPMSEKALAEHLKAFSDIEESIKFVDKSSTKQKTKKR